MKNTHYRTLSARLCLSMALLGALPAWAAGADAPPEDDTPAVAPKPLLLAANLSFVNFDSYFYWSNGNYSRSIPVDTLLQFGDPCRMAAGNCLPFVPAAPQASWPPPFWLKAPLSLEARLQASLIWDEPEEDEPERADRRAIQEAKAEAMRLSLAFAGVVRAKRPPLKRPVLNYPDLQPHVLLLQEYEEEAIEVQRLQAQAAMAKADALEARWEARHHRSAGARQMAAQRLGEKQALQRLLAMRIKLLNAGTPLVKTLLQAETAKAEAGQQQQGGDVQRAETVRTPERQAESRQTFAMLAAGMAGNMVALKDNQALRHELKREALRPALRILTQSPEAASLPACKGGGGECMPDAEGIRMRGGVRELRSIGPAKPVEGLLLPATPLSAQVQTRMAKLPLPALSFLPEIRQKRALLIGINHYQDRDIPSLESAVRDVAAVGQSLASKQGYQVQVVQDVGRAEMVEAIVQLAANTAPEDSVVVYYAGHGFLDEDTGKGYWIPSDGRADTPDKWLSNEDISRLLALIPARQVMLVSDSCYLGSLTREHTLQASELDHSTKEVLARRSVIVMSSGGEEPVSDEGKEGFSIFAWSMQRSMQDVSRISAGGRLFGDIRTRVMASYPQTPQYGASMSAGHQVGGDYLFERRVYR